MNNLIYSIKQGTVQIFRNKGMSFAPIFSILAMLLILGVFFVIVINLNLFTEVVKQDYDEVEIFLVDSVDETAVSEMTSQIESQPGVTDVTYRSKDDALEIMKERWGESGYLLDSLGKNPLPASLVISVGSMDDAQAISQFAGGLEGVEDVQFYQETVDKLTKITDFLQIGALVVMVFLVIVSVVVISNTVKLTVAARANEIRIMRYVGATSWFIRGPFMAEGIIIGLIASLLSSGLICLLYDQVLRNFGDQIMAIVSCPLIPLGYMAGNTFIIFIALGVSIGAWGSILSMRKFLKA